MVATLACTENDRSLSGAFTAKDETFGSEPPRCPRASHGDQSDDRPGQRDLRLEHESKTVVAHGHNSGADSHGRDEENEFVEARYRCTAAV
jgi:hypothetical protein